ncbi:uncharacterized protein N7443_003789 [Penicillium atrosanguineum]|nr:uncharacterized protein N7443_003789 [Penicillium atrosanguineum]KAJ5304129.1 hypothetical protein N7443_003789 [Penicillium atrosanguineum]
MEPLARRRSLVAQAWASFQASITGFIHSLALGHCELSIIVTGIEAAGLALALIPLLVNQIDGYARGIEKTKRWKYFRRELETYCVGLNIQHTILQSVLEQVPEDVVEDEEAVVALILNPRGAGWRSPKLLQALRTKFGRNYEPFVGNINELCELLERLSTRLGLPTTDTGLQVNLVEHASNPSKQKPLSNFRVVFSNAKPISITGVWDWREVMFEPQEIECPQMLTHSSNEQSGPEAKKRRVRFEDIPEKATQMTPQVFTTSQIQDLCSSLQGFESPLQPRTPIGFILEDRNPAFRYVMHAVQSIQHKTLKHSLREALTSMSRRDRLHIAASIACAVLQYHGNWLKDQWDSSDFHLVAEPFDSSVLQSLGLSLVELSLGRPMDVLLAPNWATQDDKGTMINNALGLTKEVYEESDLHYANFVDSCLS